MRDYLKKTDGGGAVEFGLVLPLLLLFTFGLIEFGMILYTYTQLHWAAEDAARCAVVRQDCMTSNAVNSGKVTNWATSHYKGLSQASWSFATNGSCSLTGTNSTNSGRVVTGATTFKFNVGVMYRSVPLSAKACFPY